MRTRKPCTVICHASRAKSFTSAQGAACRSCAGRRLNASYDDLGGRGRPVCRIGRHHCHSITCRNTECRCIALQNRLPLPPPCSEYNERRTGYLSLIVGGKVAHFSIKAVIRLAGLGNRRGGGRRFSRRSNRNDAPEIRIAHAAVDVRAPAIDGAVVADAARTARCGANVYPA